MSRSLRVGIIGTGFGASVQLPGFKRIKGVEVVGNVSGKDIAAAEEMIDSPQTDLISVAVPQFAQEKYVRKAIEAGKAVLCEKPFTLDSKTGLDLFKKAKAAGIFQAIDFEFRELRAFQLIKDRLGHLGKLKKAEIKWLVGTWADPDRSWSWHCDRTKGGGVLSALGVHVFDLAEWFFGEIERVKARTSIKIDRRRDKSGKELPVTAEDAVIADAVTQTGVEIRFEISNSDSSGSGMSVEIQGTQGGLKLSSSSAVYGSGMKLIETFRRDRKTLLDEAASTEPDPRVPLFAAFAGRLIEALSRGERNFSPSFYEGVRTQMIREAMIASAASGDWCRISKLIRLRN